MAKRPGHRVSRSFHVTVLPMAPSFTESNRKVEFSPRVRYCQREASTVVRKFESQEPTSPKIGCMGQIKRKPHCVKPSKQVGADKAVEDNNNKPSKLKKLMLRRRQKNNKVEEEEAVAVKSEEPKIGFPSLGQTKRYTSGSYDDKFGNMFVEEGPIVAKSGPLILEGFPAAVKREGTEESGIDMWKRRSVSRLTVDVNRKTAERFVPKKPFTK